MSTSRKTVAELSVEVDNIKDIQLSCQNRLNNNLEKIHKKLDTLEEKVNTRLPTWATAVFGLLTGVIGWFISVVY